MKHKLLMGFAFLLGALLFSLNASAGIFDPVVVYKITSLGGGGVVEIGGGGTVPNDLGSPANMWPYFGGPNQEWYIRDAGAPGSGLYKLVNRNSNQVLEIGGSSQTQLEWGARANQWPDYNNPNQQWSMNVLSTNNSSIYTVEIVNANSQQLLSTDEQLSSNGGEPVYQATRRSNPNSQRWVITVAGTQPTTLGVYSIINQRSNQALEVGGSSLNQGASVNQWPFFNNSNQQWVITDEGQGFYSIKNRNSGQALEIGGGDQANYQQGRAANQYPYWGGQNQQWFIDFATGIIKNRKSGQVLEIGGTYSKTVSNGSPANQWPDYGNSNQRWNLNFVSQYRVAQPTATAQQRINNQALALYPNPAQSMLTFTLANNAKATAVSVVDMRGSVVKQALYLGHNQVDVSGVAAGIYVLTIVDGEQTYRQKFVKE
jgi:hypothetical protein